MCVCALQVSGAEHVFGRRCKGAGKLGVSAVTRIALLEQELTYASHAEEALHARKREGVLKVMV